MLKQLIAHRRALHRIPELDDQLPKTQAYLLSQLEGHYAGAQRCTGLF